MTANVIRIKWIDADACYKVSQPGWDGGNVVMEDDYIKLKAEFERLRHYADTCGGSDNDGRCPMRHILSAPPPQNHADRKNSASD